MERARIDLLERLSFSLALRWQPTRVPFQPCWITKAIFRPWHRLQTFLKISMLSLRRICRQIRVERDSDSSKLSISLFPPYYNTQNMSSVLDWRAPTPYSSAAAWRMRTTHFKCSSNQPHACKKALSFAYFCCGTLISQRTANPCSTPL